MLRRLFLLTLLTFPALAGAVERVVPAADGALAAALKTAQAGDVLRLSKGIYAGPLAIDVSVTIDGNGATIDGQGVGSVITVNAPDVTLRGLTIVGSGSAGDGLDAGVTLTKRADRAVVAGNRVLGNLVGIDVHGPAGVLVQGNIIQGRQDRRMNDRGNGVYIWNAPGTKVIGNDVRWGRDGVFVNTSANMEFTGNRFRDLRFAVHYMYANDSVVSGNISTGNHLGYAVMYSDNVKIEGNISSGDRDHGIMMNYTNKSLVSGNRIENGGKKCVFIYNAHKNRFQGNSFEACDIGIHFTAGSERNEIQGNAFIANRTQVKYVGSKWVDWSVDGRGNYWSDHGAFDLDGNGIADAAYRPNDIMDHVLWTQPAAKSLLGSPAVQLIRWSQSAFPALLPGGVIDRAPLMRPPVSQTPVWKEIQ
ncbi:MAG: nitrous oxide reductase family maturation protein NosD [Marinosulfonomonas sp.]|nr:nitrous oxide reductase family maturation protein NosD [Marinosulfonomonas sp.]